MTGDRTDDAPVAPPSGTRVVLLSQRTGLTYDATVEQWRGSPGGLDVTVRLTVAAEVAEHLADQRLWVSLASPGRDFRDITGTLSRARMATPFHERCPTHRAP